MRQQIATNQRDLVAAQTKAQQDLLVLNVTDN